MHDIAMLCVLAFRPDRMPSATMPYFFSLPLTYRLGVWNQTSCIDLMCGSRRACVGRCGMSASSHACSHARNPAPGWWEDRNIGINTSPVNTGKLLVFVA